MSWRARRGRLWGCCPRRRRTRGNGAAQNRRGVQPRELPGYLEILPTYARPLFLRITEEIAATETFKPRRKAYLEEGFDPKRIKDPLYVFDIERKFYVILDGKRYTAMLARILSP